MVSINTRFATSAALGLAVGLAGCANHVTQEQFDERIAEIRSQVEQYDSRISDNERAIEELRDEQRELREALEQLREDFDAHLRDHPEGLALTLPVHFEFDKSEIRPVDRPILDRFASVVQEHLPEGTVTVEGFADPAGTDAYNQRLSERRANAVRDYLVEEAGLSGDMVRAVAYGENRLVSERQGPGRAGIENRRVTFVIEFSGEVGG